MPVDVEQDYELPGEEDEEIIKTFKDFVAEDVEDVFFCLDEFAETHNIDGTDMPVMLETDALQDHSAHWEAGSKQNYDEGLYDAHMVLYVKAKDYGDAPKVGKALYLDEDPEMWEIKDFASVSGVYCMTLGRVRL